jgi:hypothetical protein
MTSEQDSEKFPIKMISVCGLWKAPYDERLHVAACPKDMCSQTECPSNMVVEVMCAPKMLRLLMNPAMLDKKIHVENAPGLRAALAIVRSFRAHHVVTENRIAKEVVEAIDSAIEHEIWEL